MAGNVGQRGKAAEDQVRKWLKDHDVSHRCFFRIPDRRSGAKVPVPADFLICQDGRLILLEVKEVDHAFRLPRANFNASQRARMRMWEAAGAHAFVLVKFNTKDWTLLPVGSLGMEEGGSWVMEQQLSLNTILEALFERAICKS